MGYDKIRYFTFPFHEKNVSVTVSDCSKIEYPNFIKYRGLSQQFLVEFAELIYYLYLKTIFNREFFNSYIKGYIYLLINLT